MTMIDLTDAGRKIAALSRGRREESGIQKAP